FGLADTGEADDVFRSVARPVGARAPGVRNRLTRVGWRAAARRIASRAAVHVDQIFFDAVAVRVRGRAVADIAIGCFSEDTVAVHVEAASSRLIAPRRL